MEPDWFARNFTPTSVPEVSESAATAGVAAAGQIEHGQVGGGGVPPPTVTVRAGAGASVHRLSSVARVRILRTVFGGGVNVYVHDPRPFAGCQEAPSSVDTSTPPT